MSGLRGTTGRLLAVYGRPMIYQRRTAPGGTWQPVTVTGKLRAYRPQEIAGLLQQGDAEVVIGPSIAPIAGVPTANDRIVVDGAAWAVMGATPRHVGADIDGWTLHVRGGAR